MAKRKESDLKERLERYRQIKLTVVGRKTGQRIPNPVWFVFEDEKLYLLPVHGPTLNGTATCLRTHRFGSTHEERRPGFEPFPLGNRTQSNPSLKSSVRSTEQVT